MNLEKRHYKQSTVSRLEKNEDDFTTSDKEILHECEVFYKDPHPSKVETDSNPLVSESFYLDNDTVISNQEREATEGFLMEAEFLYALKDMELEKSPGTDGLPSEFYKTMWIEISYGAFLVSKFKPPIETFDPSIQIWNCLVQTFDPSISTFNPSVQIWNGSIQAYDPSIQI